VGDRYAFAEPGATQLFSSHQGIVDWLRFKGTELIADNVADVCQYASFAAPGYLAMAALWGKYIFELHESG
jgi:hypothetical protein